jgi:neurotransmitter:Na+ symporter, NSS family
VIVAFFVEELRMKRRAATWLATATVSVLGIMCVLSSSTMSEFHLFGFTVFDLMNFTSANILLPLGGFLIVIFVAWFLGREKAEKELSEGSNYKSGYIHFFMFVIKYLAPVAIAFIFLQGIGLIKLG